MESDLEYDAYEYLERHKVMKEPWSDATWHKIDVTTYCALLFFLLAMAAAFPKLVEWKVGQITHKVVRQEVDAYLAELELEADKVYQQDMAKAVDKFPLVPAKDLQGSLEQSEEDWDSIQSTLPVIEGETK